MNRSESTKLALAAKNKKFRDPKFRANLFWSRVNKYGRNGCWIWTGSISTKGYGSLKLHGKFKAAHRYAMELSGIHLKPGDNVLHHCDNPPCCNPDHLFVGTLKDNSQDAARKGHLGNANGSKQWCARLNAGDIPTIRSMRRMGAKAIADKFGVSQSAIWKVLNGITWKHIASP